MKSITAIFCAPPFSRKTDMKRQSVFFVLILVLLLYSLACGKKGPPVPPTYVEPPAVEGLQIELTDDTAILKWPVPEWTEKGGNALAGFYVYQARLTLAEAPCLDCPLPFEKIAEIAIPIGKSDIVCPLHLEKGFHYAFKISVVTQSGHEGETSAAVSIDY